MPPKKKSSAKSSGRAGRNLEQTVRTDAYEHPEATAIQRPEAGQQIQFRKKQPARIYRYDSSLSPTLDWDGQNPSRQECESALARMRGTLEAVSRQIRTLASASLGEKEALEQAEALLREDIEKLAANSRPFLNWAGKAERLSFEVPTLPLFVHEKLSTQAIIASLRSHRRDEQAGVLSLDLFGDQQQSIADKLVRAYEHQGKWVNRMILGDSLVVMNSLLHYEKLGGQVQMIYLDPPYGVNYDSNFQPFVRRREVRHNSDPDLSREPETVQAYRDTWALGLHSYLTYLRDRLLVARDLLTEAGSIFVQISNQNLHHVRELMDEVFGSQNFLSVINFRKKSMPLGAKYLEEMNNYLLWYGRDSSQTKYRQLYREQEVEGLYYWNWVELPDGSKRKMTPHERGNHSLLPAGSTPASLVSLQPPTFSESAVFPVRLDGKDYWPMPGSCWISSQAVMQRLADEGRLVPSGKTLRYFYKLSDFPYTKVTNQWPDMGSGNFTDEKIFTVQTSVKVLQRCVLMSTDPGDLVLDPTCGSGTTAYVAEEWGRRWITIDTSRVPLALARQRLLVALYPWYSLSDATRGPGGGFVFRRKQNNRGEEIGGIVPHATLSSIASGDPAKEEVLVDRPEVDSSIVRVAGPFWVEATIPTPVDFDEDGVDDSSREIAEEHGAFVQRMIEVLRRAPALLVSGSKTVRVAKVRPPAKSLSLNAEAEVDGRPVAFVFGPEHGAVGEKLVFTAAKEANAKHYSHLYVVGFAIQPDARMLIAQAEAALGVSATYVQATPDLMMADLLKTTRTSQVFSVCGLPDINVRSTEDGRWQVELLGLDTFDPITNEVKKLAGNDVPAWLLDIAWNEQVFHVSQAFFPRTEAWENLRKALKADYAESLWEHLAGTVSAPFDGQRGEKIAAKVIDERGNELQVVKALG